MKRNIFGTLATCTLMSAAFTACDLDEYNPTQVSMEEQLATPEGIAGMQVLCYQPIYAQLYSVFDFMQVAECGTDIWWCDRNRTNIEQMFYYEGLTPQTGKGWDKSFTQLYSSLGICNTVIKAGEDSEDETVKTLVAETYFLQRRQTSADGHLEVGLPAALGEGGRRIRLEVALVGLQRNQIV